MPSALATIDRTADSERSGTRPLSSSRIGAVGERLEVEGEEVPPSGAPVRPDLEELRAGERDDQDRDVPAPLEQVVDEVERPRIGPVEVLEDHRHQVLLGHPLEVQAPCAEQFLRAAGRPSADAEQRAGARAGPGCAPRPPGTSARRSPPSFTRVVSGSSVSRSWARARTISPSAQNVMPWPYAGDRPSCQKMSSATPSDVLAQLPGEPALADAGLARDGHEPDALLARRRVEQVLQQAKLGVAPHERWLEPVAATRAAAPGHDPERVVRRDRAPPCP